MKARKTKRAARVRRGLILVLDPGAGLVEVREDALGIAGRTGRGRTFTSILTASDLPRALEFLRALRRDGTAFGWALQVESQGAPTLHFAGGARGDGSLLMLATPSELELAELCHVHPEAAELTDLREAASSSLRNDRATPATTTMEEMALVQSDLARLQREADQRTAMLERLDAERNRFLAMVAHDLRNPLNAVRLLTSLISDSARERLSEDELSHLARIERLSTSMSKMSEGLLEASRFDLDAPSLELEDTDMVEVVAETLAVNGPMGSRKGIELCFEAPPTRAMARVDPDRIQQVLDNLVSNAIKFSESGTSVRIEIGTDDPKEISVSVADQGLGIPVEEQGTVFRPFAKTSTRPTGDEESFGFGLAICRQIVVAHGGTIGLESAPGSGSVFRFTVPRAD